MNDEELLLTSEEEYDVELEVANSDEWKKSNINYRVFVNRKVLEKQLAKARPIIEKQAILNEQMRSSGALRELFKRGWTLNDLMEAEDTMEEAYTNIVEEAKKQEREKITNLLDAEIAKIDKDERYHYQPAQVQINAPLALIQTGMEAQMGLLKRLKRDLKGGESD